MALTGSTKRNTEDGTIERQARERPLRLMRLRAVVGADFRKSELGNYVEACARFPQLLQLGPHDVVALHSHSGTQVVFVYGFMEVEPANGQTRQCLRSERIRLTQGGTWSELMIGDYAERAGIKLEGIKKFAEHMLELRKGLEEEWKREQPAMAARAEEVQGNARTRATGGKVGKP